MKQFRTYGIMAAFLALIVLIQGGSFPAKATDSSFDVVYGFQGNMAVFEKDGKQGAMNARQMVIIPPIYDYISLFEHGLARVLVEKKWGVVRNTGEIVIQPQYDYISAFLAESQCPPDSKPIGCLVLNGKMGFMDSSGKIICEPRFEVDEGWSHRYTRDGIYVLENGLWGILGTDGRMVAQPQYVDPVPWPWEKRHAYVYITDVTVTNGLTLEEVYDRYLEVDYADFEAYIVLLSAVYKNTKWYRTDSSGAIVQEITNLDDFDIWPFRKGVVMHEFELQGLPEDDDPYAVVYMNAYGDVLRVLRNRQYKEADSSGMFSAWDSWDMGY